MNAEAKVSIDASGAAEGAKVFAAAGETMRSADAKTKAQVEKAPNLSSGMQKAVDAQNRIMARSAEQMIARGRATKAAMDRVASAAGKEVSGYERAMKSLDKHIEENKKAAQGGHGIGGGRYIGDIINLATASSGAVMEVNALTHALGASAVAAGGIIVGYELVKNITEARVEATKFHEEVRGINAVTFNPRYMTDSGLRGNINQADSELAKIREMKGLDERGMRGGYWSDKGRELWQNVTHFGLSDLNPFNSAMGNSGGDQFRKQLDSDEGNLNQRRQDAIAGLAVKGQQLADVKNTETLSGSHAAFRKKREQDRDEEILQAQQDAKGPIQKETVDAVRARYDADILADKKSEGMESIDIYKSSRASEVNLTTSERGKGLRGDALAQVQSQGRVDSAQVNADASNAKRDAIDKLNEGGDTTYQNEVEYLKVLSEVNAAERAVTVEKTRQAEELKDIEFRNNNILKTLKSQNAATYENIVGNTRLAKVITDRARVEIEAETAKRNGHPEQADQIRENQRQSELGDSFDALGGGRNPSGGRRRVRAQQKASRARERRFEHFRKVGGNLSGVRRGMNGELLGGEDTVTGEQIAGEKVVRGDMLVKSGGGLDNGAGLTGVHRGMDGGFLPHGSTFTSTRPEEANQPKGNDIYTKASQEHSTAVVAAINNLSNLWSK